MILNVSKDIKILPADCGKVTPSGYQSLGVETLNHASGYHCHVQETPTVGYLGDKAEPRLLTLCIFREFSEKLFVLFFVLPKVPASGTLAQKQATHFLYEVLRAKGYRVNTLGRTS